MGNGWKYGDHDEIVEIQGSEEQENKSVKGSSI